MDADDKLVRELAPNKQAHAGSYQHTWDGKDRRNSVVADGVYTVAVERTDVQLPRISALVTVKTAAAPTPDAPPVAPSSNLVLSGRIKAIAATPKPGTVPYKDCVVAIYLTNMTVTHGTLKDEEILVYTWGLRDNVQTKAANYHTGQTVTLSLTPWEKVSGKYDGYRRCEVADDNAVFLNAYWGE